MNSEVKKQLTKIFLLLFALFSFLLVALSFKFYFAFSTNEEIVTDHYYEIGANYDSYLKEAGNSHDRNLLLSPIPSGIKAGTNTIRLNYLNTSNKKSLPIANGEIFLEITKRATVKGRIQKKCYTDESGNCEISFQIHPGAKYELSIRAKDANGNYNIREPIEL